jgi:hypothetical protein
MPFDDDLAAMLADAGEPLTLNGQPIHGLFDVQGEVVLDGMVTTATTAEVLAADAAQPDQTLVRVGSGVSYIVRRVLPQPPDGALHQLVLAKV